MKRLLYIFTIAVLALTGCKKENQPTLKDNDQEPWATSYKVSVAGETLTMVAQDGTDETNVYAKTTIPDGVKENFSPPYAY